MEIEGGIGVSYVKESRTLGPFRDAFMHRVFLRFHPSYGRMEAGVSRCRRGYSILVYSLENYFMLLMKCNLMLQYTDGAEKLVR